MASDTGEEKRPPRKWLLETTREVEQTLADATTPTELGETLPTAFVAATRSHFAWIGETSETGIRIRSSSTELAGKLLTDGGHQETTLPTATVESTGEIQIETGEQGPSVNHPLAEHVELPETTTRVSLPLVTEHQGNREIESGPPAESEFPHTTETGSTWYGVVHVYTDADIATPPSAETKETLSTLARSISERFRSLIEANQLRRERQRLESFRSMVSHDLGNPLNIASGRLELTKEDCDSKHIDHTIEAIERIDALIEQGLQYVEVGKPPDEYETRSLAALAEDCWESVADDRGSLEVTDLQITASPERLRMLLNELFRNSLLHSDGNITVTVAPRANRDGFYVADDGPGIDEQDREYVFDMGYTTRHERAGNGLTLVEQIAGAHDWEVELTAAADGTRIDILTDKW